jgi:hypothetical protein
MDVVATVSARALMGRVGFVAAEEANPTASACGAHTRPDIAALVRVVDGRSPQMD